MPVDPPDEVVVVVAAVTEAAEIVGMVVVEGATLVHVDQHGWTSMF